ncbi:hypothetical protein KBI33_03675, partial [Candidatus Shapirobacteria bacterium]|nr:hypothetical protein [Candidatus Shapirobacteria bacterium]
FINSWKNRRRYYHAERETDYIEKISKNNFLFRNLKLHTRCDLPLAHRCAVVIKRIRAWAVFSWE